LKTAWYVDDDKNTLQITRLMLKLVECEMRPFSSVRDAAQALLAGERPDIIILDVNIPDVSGIDLLEFIRRRQTWKQLPVIMLSSENDTEQVRQAISVGADGWVLKPILLDELEITIQAAIKKRANS